MLSATNWRHLWNVMMRGISVTVTGEALKTTRVRNYELSISMMMMMMMIMTGVVGPRRRCPVQWTLSATTTHL